MLVPVSGLLSDVCKAASVDPDGVDELVRFGLYEALCDMVDANSRLLNQMAAQQSSDVRKALVRTFVSRRLAGAPVADLLEVAKDDLTDEDHKARSERVKNEPRNPFGQWTKGGMDALAHLTDSTTGVKDKAEAAGQKWDEGRYGRMQLLGNALMASGDPTVAGAGLLTRTASEIGPEAERILSPGLRRTAYRYRGTERRPDSVNARNVAAAKKTFAAYNSDNPQVQSLAVQQIERGGPGTAPLNMVRHHAHSRNPRSAGVHDERLEQRITGDVAASYLIHSNHIPTMDEAKLSWHSGKTPPSVGVMIDRDGDVVSEAMGYNGDHYIPFDLKNMKRLHGGQYVRTRALGGPTTEDIYTGLLTGARRMTVVSNSGVFTVEFDPDLRGGRRYSDKARQMVSRYAAILERINESGAGKEGRVLYNNDISDKEKNEIKLRLIKEAKDAKNYNPKVIESRLDQEVEILRAERELTDDPEIEEAANHRTESEVKQMMAQGQTVTAQGRARLKDSIKQELKAKQPGVDTLRLNGEGYARALKSLQREFPYYIADTHYETLPEFVRSRHMYDPKDPESLPKDNRGAGYKAHVGAGKVMESLQANARQMDERGVHNRTLSSAERKAREAKRTETEAETTPAQRRAAAAGGTAAAGDERVKNPLVDPLMPSKLGPTFAPISAAITGEPGFPPLNDNKLMEDKEALTAGGPLTYLKWLYDPEVTGGDGGRVARYFMQGLSNVPTTKAPPTRAMMAQAVTALRDLGANQDGESKQQLTAAANTVQKIMNIRFPFAEVDQEKEPIGAWVPEVGPTSAPYPVKEFEKLPGASNREFNAVLGEQQDDPNFRSAWDEIDNTDGDEHRAERVLRLHSDLEAAANAKPEIQRDIKDRIEALNKAWALKKVQEVTQAMRELGGDAPKAQGPVAAPPASEPEPERKEAAAKRYQPALQLPVELGSRLQEAVAAGRFSFPSDPTRR